MKNKLTYPLFFIFLFLLLANISSAQEKKVLKFKKSKPFNWEITTDLKLSEEQKKKFNELDLAHEKKMIDLRADLEKAKLAKRELIHKGNFSKKDYLAAEEKIIQAENKIRLENESLKMEKYELLNKDQKKIFLDSENRDFVFKFDIDGFRNGMLKLKEKMKKILPCPPSIDKFQEEIDIEIDDNEI